MTDPMRRASASLPPTVGEGCVRRFDPEQLSDDCGAEFSGAAQLWAELQQDAQQELDQEVSQVTRQCDEPDERA
jgi:hypothetical protein